MSSKPVSISVITYVNHGRIAQIYCMTEVAMKERLVKMSVIVGAIFALVLSFSLLTGGNGQAAEKPKCIACHEKVTPGVVKQFLAGKMGKAGMDCSACHGFDHMSEKDVAKVKLPTPETCAKCHEKRVKEYREGKHALAWPAMKAMPMINHQPSAVGGGDLKGCSACLKIGGIEDSCLGRCTGENAADVQ